MEICWPKAVLLFASSGRGERRTEETARSETSNGYAPERSGGRVQNGCVSRDAADTQGWRQPCRVCLGSAPASLACSSRRLQRSACTGLSVRRNAGKAGMLGAPTSWVAVAHANAASAKAGKGRARNIILTWGQATKSCRVFERTGGGSPRERSAQRKSAKRANS